ncbi:MAG: VOC family protein [Parvibaculaceae bacterium]
MSGASVIPTLRYQDGKAAIDWLCKAFGFTVKAVYEGPDGSIAHAELTSGSGMIMLGSAETEFSRLVSTPREAGKPTSAIYVVVRDVDAHHARAKAEGAEIVLEPRDQDYGGRDYTARDPEGYVWSFGTYDPWAASQA